MKRKNPCTVYSAMLALLLSVMTGLAQAGPGPLPTNSNAYGMGYDELAAAWLEWAVAIPAPTNPILDPTGAYGAIGQSGKVWFLAGTTGGSVERTITVPKGKAVFFPIVNYFWVNTPELGDPPWTADWETAVRNYVASVVDTHQGLMLVIDGRPVAHVEALRVASTVGACTVPDDNIFGVKLAPGPHECVADGFWALLPPMSVGKHTIRFKGGFAEPQPGFSLDVTYRITVSPR